MEILKFTPESQLIEQVRNTTMLTDKTIRPYQHADICIENIPLNKILPTQLYVLREHLEVQKDLRNALLEKGCDTLRMRGSLLLRHAGVTVGLMPPVVEDDPEFGMCLLDGTHRAVIARRVGEKCIRVVHISGVLPDRPMIAMPNQWSEIVEYSVIPEDKTKKKRYRDLPGSKYDYYRDFSEITGVGKDPRTAMLEVM